MKLALTSDIQGNAFALDSVLAAVTGVRPDMIICLGDTVGFYAHPSECLSAIVGAAQLVVAGDHEFHIAQDRLDSVENEDERVALQWTKERLNEKELAFVEQLPVHVRSPSGYLVAHGSYLSGTYVCGTVTRDSIEENLRVIAESGTDQPVAFFGNTHRPTIAWLERGQVSWASLHEGKIVWPSSASAVLVNPGSVGQPLDGDRRAAFGVVDFEERSFEVVRVDYDVDHAVVSCRNAGLPESIANRLTEPMGGG